MSEENARAPDWFARGAEAIEIAERHGMEFRKALVEVEAAPRNYALFRQLPWWSWLFLFLRLRLWFLRRQLLALPYRERKDSDVRVVRASALIAWWEFGFARLPAADQLEVRRHIVEQNLSAQQVRSGFRTRHLLTSTGRLTYRPIGRKHEQVLRVAGYVLPGLAIWTILLVLSAAQRTGCLSCEGVLLLQFVGLPIALGFGARAEGVGRKRSEAILARLGIPAL